MGIYWVYPLLKAPLAGQTARAPSEVIIFNFLALEPSCISSECLSKSLSPCHQKEAKTDRNEGVSIYNLLTYTIFLAHFCQIWGKIRNKLHPKSARDFAARDSAGGFPSSDLGESPAFTDPMTFGRRFRSFRHLTVRMDADGCGWRVLDKQPGVHMDLTRKTLEFCLRELKKQTNHVVVERKVGKSSQKIWIIISTIKKTCEECKLRLWFFLQISRVSHQEQHFVDDHLATYMKLPDAAGDFTLLFISQMTIWAN